ncbi:MAG: hypothetical protein DA443_06575 [Bacteroidetes bacterium]|nr:MAG: hypothetical protein DA443_06575 [Bacteroidota bacterium]
MQYARGFCPFCFWNGLMLMLQECTRIIAGFESQITKPVWTENHSYIRVYLFGIRFHLLKTGGFSSVKVNTIMDVSHQQEETQYWRFPIKKHQLRKLEVSHQQK